MNAASRHRKTLRRVRRLFGKFLRRDNDRRSALPTPPRFEEEELFAHLRSPEDALQAWREGRREAAWDALIEHFCRREPALGFVAPARVPGLIAKAADRFPGWRGRLLDKVEEDSSLGLAAYDRRADPLGPDFNWNLPAAGLLEDVLYGLRPHRFGFVARWAQACHHQPALVSRLEAVLAGWMAQARKPEGLLAYRTSLVVIYNLVALVLAWPFLAALDSSEAAGPVDAAALRRLRKRVLQALFANCRFLVAAAGTGVANNHLLAEHFARWLIAALLPEFDPDPDRTAAEANWLRELERQSFGDGGSIEHSLHYQELASELAVAYLLISRRNGWALPQSARERIGRMLAFQTAFAGPALLPVAIGNTTEDPMLALGAGEGWQTALLREVQRRCFDPQVAPAADDAPGREAAYWLLEGDLAANPETPLAEAPFRFFPDSGFALFAEPGAEACLIFRLGPSPAAPGIGGHSHGDLLSLCLRVGTEMVLAPPGTYSYRFKPHPDLPGRPNLRAHFASARSRSGLYLEGLEPYGDLTGDFRAWTLPCQVASRQSSAAGAGLSWTEGHVVGTSAYTGHRRGVVHLWGRGWLVYDRLPPRSDGAAAVGWQFAPGLDCRLAGDATAEAQGQEGATKLTIRPCGTEGPDLVSGGFEPFRGWVSPSYGRLEPAANLRYPLAPGARGAAFFLSLETGEAGALEEIAAADEHLGYRIEGTGDEGLLLLDLCDTPKEQRWADITFQGRLLWLCRVGEAVTVRALGLQRLLAPAWGLDLTAQTPAAFELVIDQGTVRWPRGPCPDVEFASM
ncbi:heparinase II/III family protein [Pelagibius sp.]|uniref:heparinase II/III domain-containing protein n=1 Tax=Pelagibius sp. TaxID=1931238 RepID=UPI0026380823|nr:heparinase II/III family protein [Pelagibius sp.]